MPFAFQLAQSVGDAGRSRTFKQGVQYSYFKADEKRPLTFRILPAFSPHTAGAPLDPMDYVPAVSIVGGKPQPSSWLAAILMSRPFIKGSYPIVSRKTLIQKNVDGTFVEQEDPLTKVISYCKTYKKQWGYVVEDQGQFKDPNRVLAKLPEIKPQYVMNVLTLDDEKPGVKLAIISSWMAINCLISEKEGKEGLAFKQTIRELTEEDIRQDPSCIFMYGDITDPNGAPLLHYGKGPSDNGGQMVYQIVPVYDTDTQTGRQRISRLALTPEMMAGRQDLEHVETFVNIPTPEEQVDQICQVCSGRNADGYHELDMLRVALPEYASVIPDVPSAPGAVNQVQGFTPQPAAQPTVQQVAQAAQPAPQAAPVQIAQVATFRPAQAQPTAPQQQTFRPAPAAQAAPVAPPAPPAPAAPAAPTQAPRFVPRGVTVPATAPVAAPAQPPVQAQPTAPAQAPAGVPGEASFDPEAWEAAAASANAGDPPGDWMTEAIGGR